MASKVSDISRLIGHYRFDPGGAMYHAKDGQGPDGAFNKDKRHKIRKALGKIRLRATGMTDDLIGSKETQGSLENPYEKAQAFHEATGVSEKSD